MWYRVEQRVLLITRRHLISNSRKTTLFINLIRHRFVSLSHYHPSVTFAPQPLITASANKHSISRVLSRSISDPSTCKILQPLSAFNMARRPQSGFVIAPFRQPVQLDPHFADTTWTTLKNAIVEINNRNTSHLSFEQLYRYSYNMVLYRHGDFLYNGLTNLLIEHLTTVANTIYAAESPVFLSHIQTQWGWFELSLGHTRDILMYMDRHYVKNRQKKTVHELGLSLFRDVVIRHTAILPRLSEALLSAIDRERNGEAIDRHLIRSITRMLAQLGTGHNGQSVYENVFEQTFLTRTRQFYAREALLYLSETTCSDYLRKASARINEERLRVKSYLEPCTEQKVRQVTEVELISRYMNKLVDMDNSGLIWMLRNDKLDDLRLMYTLFRDIDSGEETLRQNVKKEVLERGMALVADTENVRDPVTLVNAILALKEKYDRIISAAFTVPIPPSISSQDASFTAADLRGSATEVPYNQFQSQGAVGSTAVVSAGTGPYSGSTAVGSVLAGSEGGGSSGTKGNTVPDRKFQAVVNEAFERFINSFNRAAEFISLYVDKLLRKDLKSSSDDEVESKLDAVMTLFRYLHEKDVFERYYKLHLTKRLLHSRTTSSDAERSFMTKMKTECGYLYTSKMEVMFNDMKISADTTAAFKDKVAEDSIDMKGIDISVSVLTTMSWPITSTEKVNLPSDVSHCMRQFQGFYDKKHDGRRLTWLASLGTAEIRARFGNGTREVDLFSVSAYSLCILMLFNSADTLSYSEIAAATEIPEKELVRHLQSLSLAKYRVLRKEPRNKEVKADDKFSFNNDFVCRNRRIKMQVITAQKENESERNQTKGRIDDDRRPVIDTAIVRIMKHRKVLEHNKLIAEVTMQLASRFEPNPQDIKKRIESLVDREYLERSKEQRQIYKYMA